MQNPTQKFWQGSIVLPKAGILLQKSNYLITFVETLHIFPTYHSVQKGLWDCFVLFRSWVICHN